MIPIRFTTLIILLLSILGCAAQQPFELSEYDKSQSRIYPAISILLNDGKINSESNCTNSTCYYYRNNDDKFVLTALRGSTLFERVDINNPYSEVSFDITFSDNFAGSEKAEYAKLLLYAGTLGVVPTTSAKSSSFEVTIIKKDKVIKKYQYEASYTETNSILIDPQSGSENVVRYFTSLLLSDIEKDRLFTTD